MRGTLNFARIPSERALPGLYAGTKRLKRLGEMTIEDGTATESLALRRMAILQAEQMA